VLNENKRLIDAILAKIVVPEPKAGATSDNRHETEGRAVRAAKEAVRDIPPTYALVFDDVEIVYESRIFSQQTTMVGVDSETLLVAGTNVDIVSAEGLAYFAPRCETSISSGVILDGKVTIVVYVPEGWWLDKVGIVARA
jgi:hypothetical protein